MTNIRKKGSLRLPIWQRYLIFTIGILVQSAGIALVVKSLLGTSPISSLPYVLSRVNAHGALVFAPHI